MVNKKICGLFILIVMIGISASQIGVANDNNLKKDVTSVDYSISTNRLFMSYEFNDPKISIENNVADVSIDGLDNVMIPGNPILPIRIANILLPNDRKIVNVTTIYDENQKILIATGDARIADIPILVGTSDNSINEQNIESVYEDYNLNLTDWKIGKKNENYILDVTLYPILYNQDKKEFYFYKNIDVIVELEEESLIKIANTNYEISDIKNEEVLEMVDNPDESLIYSGNEYASASMSFETTDSYNYIIITSDYLANYTGEYNFQALLNQKQTRVANKLSGQVVTVESIYNDSRFHCDGQYGDGCNISAFNDSAAKIRNFIEYAVRNLSTEYVLLGGDVSVIPVRSFYIDLYRSDVPAAHIPSDMYYANLDGSMNANNDSYWGWTNDNTDLLSDVYVGRAPVDTYTQLSNFVRKTILYENLTINRDEPFIKNTLSVYDPSISTLSTPTNYLRTHSYSVQTLATTSNGGWIPNYINGLSQNNLPSIINNAAHGNYNYIANYGYFSNTNNSYPNFFYSQACWAGAFNNEDSFAEQLVYGQNSSYATLMNSHYGWYLPNNPNSGPGNVFMNEFWYQVLYNDISNLARANQISKQNKISYYGSYSKWLYWTQNLMGDPEISIYFYPTIINLDVIFKSPRSNYYYNNDTVLVNINCTNCSASWWSNGSANYSSPMNFTFPAGNNTIYAYANDTYGNVNSTNISFFVDLESPIININNVSGEYKRQTNVSFDFNCTDNSGGISEELIESDLSGEYVNYTKFNNTEINATNNAFYNLTIATNNSNFSYRFHVKDYAGNLNSTNWTSVNIENTVPVFNVSYSSRSFFISSNDSLNKTFLFSDVDPQVLNVSVVSSLNLNFVEDENTINISATSDSVRSGWLYIVANDSVSVTYANISVMMRPPTWVDMGSSFGGPETTNISTLSSFLNVPINLSSEHGMINFPSVNLTLEEINISGNIIMSENRVELNSEVLPVFNVPATIHMLNVSFTNATVHKNGNTIACINECEFISHDPSSRVFIFSVTGFSYYTIEEANCYDGVQNCHNGKCENGIDCDGSCPTGCVAAPAASRSGGGGGGGGFVKAVPKNYSLILNNSGIDSFTLATNDSLLIYFDNALNILNVKNVDNASIYFKLNNIYDITININERIETDLNHDNILDVEIYYENYTNKKANIYFKYNRTELTDNVFSTYQNNDNILNYPKITFDYVKSFVIDNIVTIIICLLLLAIFYFAIFLIVENRRLEHKIKSPLPCISANRNDLSARKEKKKRR